MDAKGLQNLVHWYQDHRSFISNEETTKMALVVPFLKLLGYDPNNPREVRLEYSAEFTQGDGKRQPDRMDYAIFDQKGERPLMVIEVKPLGTKLEERANQLARYPEPTARDGERHLKRREFRPGQNRPGKRRAIKSIVAGEMS